MRVVFKFFVWLMCVVGYVKAPYASAVSHANSLAKSSSETQQDTFYLNNGNTYYCNHFANNNPKIFNFANGTVVQTLYGIAYKCVEGWPDKWENVGVQWCSDTEFRELNKKGAKYCVVQDGKEQRCRVHGGDYVEDGGWSGGCLRATLPKQSCDGQAHGKMEKHVKCANIPNSADCDRKCNNGTWEYILVKCDNYYHVDGVVCTRDEKYPNGSCTPEDLAKVMRAGYASAGKYNSNLQCYATACKSGSWLVYKDGKNQGWCVTDASCPKDYKVKVENGRASADADNKVICMKVNGDCTEMPANAATAHLEWDAQSRTTKCKVDSCVSSDYEVVNNECVVVKKDLKQCSSDQIQEADKNSIVQSQIDNSEKITIKDKSGNDICFAYKCIENHHVVEGKCVAQSTDTSETAASDKVSAGESAQVSNDGTTTSAPTDENSAAAPAQTPVADGTECQSGAAHATAGVMRNGECVPSKCEDGYELKNDSCVEISGPCDSAPEHSTASHREFNPDTKEIECIVDGCASGYAESKDRLSCEEDLEEKVKAAKEREQSFANRMLGGATMAATGAGGQMLATGLAEKKADADAERQMTAYLQTMHCDYADGKQVSGGMKSVMLPGGNELINLYSQYVNLANDLKARKSALGMRPGIESEPILDGATSGLYDDVSLGKTGGAYVSLARALMNPDGADAVAWAAQKEESQKDIKTGAIVAGVGAAVGLIGNVAINHDAMKSKGGSSRTRAKYKQVTEDIEQLQPQADALPAQPCSDFNGTTNEGYVPDCRCRESGYAFSTDKGCYDQNVSVSICNKTGLVNTEACVCIAYTVEENGQCKCDEKNGYKEVSGACVKETVPQTEVAKLTLSADTTFKTGSYALTDNAKNILSQFKDKIKTHKGLFYGKDYKIVITGHTDRVPFKRGSSMNNQMLSERRAASVKTELLSGMSDILSSDKIETSGVADSDCKKETYSAANDERCRKVVITITAPDEGTDMGNLLEQVTSGVADGLGGKVGALDANLLNVK